MKELNVFVVLDNDYHDTQILIGIVTISPPKIQPQNLGLSARLKKYSEKKKKSAGDFAETCKVKTFISSWLVESKIKFSPDLVIAEFFFVCLLFLCVFVFLFFVFVCFKFTLQYKIMRDISLF